MTKMTNSFDWIYVISTDTNMQEVLGEQLKCYSNASFHTSLRSVRNKDGRTLVLISVHALSLKEVSELTKQQPNAIIAFTLVEDTKTILPYLCIAGVNGLFFKDECTEIIHKGIKFLYEGELFFPRDLLPQLVSHIKLDINHSADQLQRLSDKEHEILHFLSNGSSNLDIAEKLNVSFHTVKTHVYNIYKKLEVKNRAEAIKLSKSVLV